MKEAFYFSHDANAQHDPKVIKMLSKLGWEGYGIYWALVERLRNEADYTLECDYDCLSFALRTDKDKVKSIVLDYNLFEVYDGTFWSKSLLIRMEKKNEKSKKARESALKRWNKQPNAKQMQSEPNTIKKRKKIKENKINISFDIFWKLYDKKVNKPKCEKKWISLKDIERKLIIDTLPTFLKTITDKQYQPYPMTYLNNKRWEDEIQLDNKDEFKMDTVGVSYIGYCEKCNKSDFYRSTNDDSCCGTKILPKPITVNNFSNA